MGQHYDCDHPHNTPKKRHARMIRRYDLEDAEDRLRQEIIDEMAFRLPEGADMEPFRRQLQPLDMKELRAVRLRLAETYRRNRRPQRKE